MKFFVALTAVLSLASNHQTQAAESTYVGAVVEYSPVVRDKEIDMVNENVANYVSLILKAASKGADIVVFPEGGLNAKTVLTQIPHPSEKNCPCDDKVDGILKKLSCASRSGIYSVINLPEMRKCTEDDEGCPPSGFFKYNTNVVFDRFGVVVARYPKYNLYDERGTNKTKTVEMSFFETDFGVRFGTFICFDILFWEPTLRYIEQYGITDFAMTTYWFSELPFLTATQTQKGWAESNDVNLLVAGYNQPGIGSSGSGIYNGRFGALISTMPEVPKTKILIAEVPKKQRRDYCDVASCKEEPVENFGPPIEIVTSGSENMNSQFKLGEDQMFLFKSKVIENNKVFEETVCAENNFCCNFRVSTTLLNSNKSSYHYRAMVSDGVRHFGKNFTGGVQSCGVVLCNGPHIRNCSSRVPDLAGVIRINEIRILGKDFELRNSFHMASTLTDNTIMGPLPSHKYLFEKKDGETGREITMELLWPVSDLKTFAIWGRVFKRDGEHVTVSKAPSLTTFSWLFLLTLSSYFVFGH